MTTFEQVCASEARLRGHVRPTPLLSSPALDRMAGRRILVKAECLQHTGSFKYRGALSALTTPGRVPVGAPVMAMSSGNHAQGVARAAAETGHAAVILMPSDAPETKIEGTRALGAEVHLYDRNSEDRDVLGVQLAEARGLHLIHPFNDADVIAGQGSVGLELANQLNDANAPDCEVLVCCGGGGLSSGIAIALGDARPGDLVRPVEPEEFDDVARSLRDGEIRTNPAGRSSICDAILTPAPGALTFSVLQQRCGPGLSVSDQDCLRAMALAFRHLKIVIEPGGAAALAAALFNRTDLKTDTIVAVATGGNVDASVFARALALPDADAV